MSAHEFPPLRLSELSLDIDAQQLIPLVAVSFDRCRPFEGESEPARRGPGGLVQAVAFPLEAPVTQLVECVARSEKESFGCDARARPLPTKP
jgi:hypothetical protein